MPTIGSLDGTFGHGRGPQVAPPPGFTFFPKIGNRSTWTFTANGSFTVTGNTVFSIPNTINEHGIGTSYVIVPNSTFLANVKIWAAGGGSGGNATTTRAVSIHGGAGGAVTGQILFEAGQAYTVVASGEAYSATARDTGFSGGGGGGISGIFKGNVYSVGQMDYLTPVTIAGGGAGATSAGNNRASSALGEPYLLASAGGGNLISQITPPTVFFDPMYYTNGQYVYPQELGIGGGSRSQIGQVFPQLAGRNYSGGIGFDDGNGGAGFDGRAPVPGLSQTSPRGGGGYVIGGQGFADPAQELAESLVGINSLPPLYSDSLRGQSGDSAQPGKVIIYTDEYRLGNLTATGGTVTDVPIPGYELAYRTHTFTANGKFTITSCGPDSVIDIFAVGGGGGSAGTSGAGGGSVAMRTNFSVPVTANYIVTVGAGGLASDSYATTGVGRIFGGYRGGDSAFFNNNLNKSFPDNYAQLIYSFGVQIRYIGASGDGSNGLTPTTAYPTFAAALTANANNTSLIVFAVLAGTYETSTPINDLNQPRVFVCSPGKVTINYNPSSTAIAPMMSLGNPYSALYGATIIRTMPDSTNVVNMAFFQGGVSPTSQPRARGSYYNCVFRENGNNWTLVWDQFAHPFVPENARFKIENCTFFTRNNSLEATGSDATRVLLKNCIFNKAVITNAVQVNCAANVTIGSKYVTSATDKGVYAGEYSWSGIATAPERNATPAAMVARGGGGAPLSEIPSGVASGSPELLGGTSAGNPGSAAILLPYLQTEQQANVAYSSYGYPGGAAWANYGTNAFPGGGGAGGPGERTFSTVSGSSYKEDMFGSTMGGLGIEWPENSNVYYGSGGSGKAQANISVLTPGTIGAGAGGNIAAAGNDGIVMVRYIVPSTYTPPAAIPVKNLIAHGGRSRLVAGQYREHIFEHRSNSNQTLHWLWIERPSNVKNFYMDMIIVGAGGGGAGGGRAVGWSGYPGQAIYQRHVFDNDALKYVPIEVYVGEGGDGGIGGVWFSVGSGARGANGNVSRVTMGSRYQNPLNSNNNGFVVYQANGGARGGRSYDGVAQPVIQVTPPIVDGLFSDNTMVTGGTGGYKDWPGEVYLNRVPNSNGPGGGGAGGGGVYQSQYEGYPGDRGQHGIVIIRYPIY